MVYNPNQKNEPKTKNIFKVIKPTKSSRKSSVSMSSEQNYLNDLQRHADQMNLFSSGYDYSSIPQRDEDMMITNSNAFNLPGFSTPFVTSQVQTPV